MINNAGLDLIKKYEGLRLTAYQDSVGIWTLGYGHTGGVQEGDTCTLAQATAWLLKDISYAEEAVYRAVTSDISDNQRAALVSFCFNVGPGKEGVKDGLCVLKDGGQSLLLIYTNIGAFGKAADEFPKWAKAGGVVIMGLMKRRMDERALFMLQ